MTASECDPIRACDGGDDLAAGGEVVELTLLLPRDHFVALGSVAEVRGITIASLLRQELGDYPAREWRRPNADPHP